MTPQQNNPAPVAVAVDGKNFTIGVLAVTATILFVGFLLVTRTPRSAQAIGHLDRQDDYIIMTHQISNSREQLFVVDAAVKTAIVYELRNKRDFNIVQRIPLDRLPLPPRK